MERPTFTPSAWYSADGKWKFMMDKHGMTDMIPTHKNSILEYVLKNYTDPYEDREDHIH